MRLLFLIVLAGCGTDTFRSGDASPSSEGGAEASAMDGGSDRKCDPMKPFAGAKPVAELDIPGMDDATARLTPETLGVFFSRSGTLFSAGRMSTMQPFGNVMPIPGINKMSSDFDAWPSLVGNELYFTRMNAAGTGIYLATNFGNPAPIPAIGPSGPILNFAPYALFGGVMYFSRNDHIVRTERVQGMWGAGTDLPAPVNLAGSTNVDAAITPDELHIYFASDRTGSQGMDIWGSARGKATAAWGTPLKIDSINSNDDDLPTWISPDDCGIVFSRRSQGQFDIWYAQRQL